jgi:hypothetical protein
MFTLKGRSRFQEKNENTDARFSAVRNSSTVAACLRNPGNSGRGFTGSESIP